MIMDRIWSNLHLDHQSNFQDQDSFEWIFVKDLNPSILTLHEQVIQFYFEGLLPKKTKCPKVIKTPQELFHKHLTTKPISYWKAIDLAKNREDLEQIEHPTLHCFENPGTFYKYPNLKLLISKDPVRCHVVLHRKCNNPSPSFQGYRWAVFEIIGPQNSLHFDVKKWSRIPEVLK